MTTGGAFVFAAFSIARICESFDTSRFPSASVASVMAVEICACVSPVWFAAADVTNGDLMTLPMAEKTLPNIVVFVDESNSVASAFVLPAVVALPAKYETSAMPAAVSSAPVNAEAAVESRHAPAMIANNFFICFS